MKTLTELQTELANYKADENCPDEHLAIRCCELACESLANGCYGVGAILVDENRSVLAEAGNRIFMDGFHSGRHAEMVVMDMFEERYRNYGDRSGLTLMVSLEPCPMCLTRSLLAGIGRIVYLAADNDGGLVQRLEKMPPAWENLASLQKRERALSSELLKDLAAQLATCSLQGLRQRLMESIRGPS
jgi:tRNA(adenine34) deaminase